MIHINWSKEVNILCWYLRQFDKGRSEPQDPVCLCHSPDPLCEQTHPQPCSGEGLSSNAAPGQRVELPASVRRGAVRLGALGALKRNPDDQGTREERLREEVQPGEMAPAAGLTSVCGWLVERPVKAESGAPPIPTVLGEEATRTSCNTRNFSDMRIIFFPTIWAVKHCHRLPSEAVKSPSLQISITWPETAWGHPLWLELLWTREAVWVTFCSLTPPTRFCGTRRVERADTALGTKDSRVSLVVLGGG